MASKVVVPKFAPTPVDSIAQTCETVRATFRTNKTKDLAWRKVQLRKLYWALTDYTPQICEALKTDLHKSAYETVLTELDFVKNDCMFMLNNLDRFARDEPMGTPQVPLAFALARFRTRKEPLGAVLIIGAYNYPLNLLLCPFVGAIAAGCTAVVKPSEVAPATAAGIRELVEARLDLAVDAVVNGAVAAATALLDHKGDKILYTGGC